MLDTAEIDYRPFFDALPPDHLDFFLNLEVSHLTPDVLCVHGGSPGGSEATSDDVLIWGPPGFPDSYEDQQLVVYGHHDDAVLDDDAWPHPRVTRDRTFGIDSIRHGVLTAMRFPDRAIFQSRRCQPK